MFIPLKKSTAQKSALQKIVPNVNNRNALKQIVPYFNQFNNLKEVV